MENILQVEREISEIKSEQAAQHEQIRTIFGRMDKQDKLISSLNDLAVSMRLLTEKQDRMGEKVEKIGEELIEIKEKPGRRWEAIVEKLVMAAVAAVAAYILGRVGL